MLKLKINENIERNSRQCIEDKLNNPKLQQNTLYSLLEPQFTTINGCVYSIPFTFFISFSVTL